MYINHNLSTDDELHYHKCTVSEVFFAITPSDPVSLILSWPFPALPAAGLEAVQGQKHRSSSLVHNNTAANKEEQRSSCSNPNSWRWRHTSSQEQWHPPHGLQCHSTNTVQNSVKLQFQHIHLEAGVVLLWIMPAHCFCPTCELCHADSIDKLFWSTFTQLIHTLV